MDLFSVLDDHLTRPRISMNQKMSLWPSMASVVMKSTGRIEGKCMRAAYYNYMLGSGRMQIDPNLLYPNDAYSEWIFAIGKQVENMIVAYFKEAGLWIDNSIKFYDSQHEISGEIDCIIHDPLENRPIICEIKSFYGHYAHKEIIGTKNSAGFPRVSNLLQLSLYIDYCKRNNVTISYNAMGRRFDNMPLEVGKLLYMARDDIARKEYRVELDEENIKVNDYMVKEFKTTDIYDRYRALLAYIKAEEVPPNDYVLEYTDEQIEELYRIGVLSKTKYDKFKKKGIRPGDWQCKPGYCEFSRLCWGEQGGEENDDR